MGGLRTFSAEAFPSRSDSPREWRRQSRESPFRKGGSQVLRPALGNVVTLGRRKEEVVSSSLLLLAHEIGFSFGGPAGDIGGELAGRCNIGARNGNRPWTTFCLSACSRWLCW